MEMQPMPPAPRKPRAPRKQGIAALADRIAGLRMSERTELAVLLAKQAPEEFLHLKKVIGEVPPPSVGK